MSWKPYVCIQTNSTCYKKTRQMDVKGVLWHSTGANNPNLCRYVQPSEKSATYDEAITKLGKNKNGNDWNHIDHNAGLNAWIGRFADGSVGTVQTMPWDYRPWGCGSGEKGSLNNGWVQFEICEDALKDKEYAEQVFEEGCHLTAHLCRIFKLNPKGNVNYNGISVPVITCHNDAAKLKLGNNHADINHWFPKLLGKDMQDVRKRVAEILSTDTADTYTGALPSVELRKGDSGIQVKYLQEFLNWYGSYGLTVDGIFGSATETAVKDFQKNAGYDVTGVFDSIARYVARNTKKKKPQSQNLIAWTGQYPVLPGRGYYMKGDGYTTYTNLQTQIKSIQAFLLWALDIKLTIDGRYGAKTVEAVKAFQKLVNIKQDGRYGRDTLQKAILFKKAV